MAASVYICVFCIYTDKVFMCMHTPSRDTVSASLLVGLKARNSDSLASIRLEVAAPTLKSTPDE